MSDVDRTGTPLVVVAVARHRGQVEHQTELRENWQRAVCLTRQDGRLVPLSNPDITNRADTGYEPELRSERPSRMAAATTRGTPASPGPTRPRPTVR